MLRLAAAVLALVVSLLALQERAFACASLRVAARIDTFGCNCSEGNLESPITVVSGTALLGNGRATPTLASIVVELQARQGSSPYQPIARQVLSDAGTDFPPPRSVATCNGPIAAGAITGRIKLVDANEQPLNFSDVKNIPVGVTPLRFIATFAGPLPELAPGSHARVKVYTTAINTDQPHTCTIDADGDGTIDSEVKTLIFQKAVRVPTVDLLINP
ncbi:MAG: hypothetical protein HY271_11700 [Deltaproteobacteria bacterium]|nr:hypothetical protein [Deltaproteobacteria bacterium]